MRQPLFYAVLAQLAERSLGKAEATSSILVVSTKKSDEKNEKTIDKRYLYVVK